MENKEQTCKNCKYFKQYYYCLSTHFRKTEYGACLLKRSRRKSFFYSDSCEKFEPVETKDGQIQNNILDCFTRIQSHLEYIATVLTENDQ